MIAEVLPSDVPVPDEFRGVEQEVSALERLVHDMTINSEEEHRTACELERRLADEIAAVKARTTPGRQAAHRAWKEFCDLENHLVAPLERAKPILKALIGSWRRLKAQEAEAEAQRLRDLARRQAEAEALERAQRLQDRGEDAAALAVLDRPMVAPVVITAAPLKSYGVKVQKRWSANVEDMTALLRWVLESPSERLVFVEANMAALNRQAVTYKAALNIPGVMAAERDV
jgi:hypothetical protein